MTMMRGFKTLLSIVLLLIVAGAGQVLAAPVKILALGSSLTQGYGLPPGTEFTVQLQAALKKVGIDAVVTNAGVSGDTSAGGLARLDWSLGDHPDAVILELGSNDMLRGIAPGRTLQCPCVRCELRRSLLAHPKRQGDEVAPHLPA